MFTYRHGPAHLRHETGQATNIRTKTGQTDLYGTPTTGELKNSVSHVTQCSRFLVGGAVSVRTVSFTWDSDHRSFLDEHVWAILATGRRDGSPQQSMVGYAVDDDGRLLISVKSYTAKWKNALRQPVVSLTVPDGRAHLVVYGKAELISSEPARSALTAQVFAALSGAPAPEPSSIVEMLEEQQRTVLRVTPEKAIFHS